ncbi:MAG: type II toxin-antitoxin system Phd/YefM family antitoxin [Bifidobacteriaceae bacterium]|nr:type II toxin-antitoxin system Phd/YefM family antitoxin [Bifidobacteriaceae bacterium]
MRTVNKRELNHRTAAVLDQVARTGEPVAVTDRGVPKWRITPFDEPGDGLARAAREGRLTRASAAPGNWPQPARLGKMTPEDLSRLIADMKSER